MTDGAVPEATPEWRVLAALAGVAVAHVGVLLVPAGDLTLPSLALVEGGVALVLVSALLHSGAAPRAVGAFLGAFAGLAGGAIAAFHTTDRLWAAALVLGLAAATLTYGLHRYGLVRTNAVEPTVEDR